LTFFQTALPNEKPHDCLVLSKIIFGE